MAQMVSDLEMGREVFAGPSPLYRAFADRWMNEYVAPHNRGSTQRCKRLILRVHLLPAFGHLKLDEISTAKIDAFAASKIAGGLRPKTVNNILTTLRCSLAIASEWGVLRVVPRFHWLRVPAQGYSFLTADEAARLLSATASPFWRTFILFLLHTGARFGEAAAAQWTDLALDGDSPVFHIRRSVSMRVVGPTKTGKMRDVPLTSELAAALKALPRDAPFVFSLPGGTLPTPEATRNRLHRLCARAGIHAVGNHALRHTFATELTARGAPLRAVQDLLGHSTVQMTARYAHVGPSTLRACVQLLSQPRDSQPTWSPDGYQGRFRPNPALGAASVTAIPPLQ